MCYAGAVSRILTFTCAQARDDCFRLLTGGARTALPRQRTLRATLDWSYDLLTPPEQLLLRRLSVFAGGWTLEAAEAICADDRPLPTPAVGQRSAPDPRLRSPEVLDVLAALVDKSLAVLDRARPGDVGTHMEAAR